MTLPRPSRLAPLLAGLAAGAILAGAGLTFAAETPRSALPGGTSRDRDISAPPTGFAGPSVPVTPSVPAPPIVPAPPTVDVVPHPVPHPVAPAAPDRGSAAPRPEPRTPPPAPPKAAPPDAGRSKAGSATAKAPARPARQAPGDTIAAVVAATNAKRAAAGCRELRVDNRINTAAQRHSVDMAQRKTMTHLGRDGSRFTDRLRAAGYPRPGAENIAFGQPTAVSVVAAWMSSSGHRRNILNCDYTAIGVGYDPRGNYWTQNFGF